MSIFKKTYHFFSALMLLLFLSSIVFPVGVSAATLFCDMQMDTMAQPHAEHDDTCCDFHDMNAEVNTSAFSSANSCTYQKVCAEVVSGDQAKDEAITQTTQNFLAALVFSKVFIDNTDDTKPYKLVSDAPRHQQNEPIFLLNSAFLN